MSLPPSLARRAARALAPLALAGLTAPAARAAQTIYFSSQFGSGVQSLTPGAGGAYTLSTVTPDVTLPGGIAFDGAGNLLVSEYYGYNYSAFGLNGSSDIRQFTPAAGGSVTGSTFVSRLNGPNGLARDASGDLFIVENYDANEDFTKGDLLRLSPGGSPTPLVSGLTYANGVALDGHGDLFVTQNSDAAGDSNSGSLLELTPLAGGYTQTSIATGLASPYGVSANAAGDVFVANIHNAAGAPNSGTVLEFAPSVVGFTQSTVASGLNESIGALVSAEGNLFVSTLGDASGALNTGSVLEFTPGAGGAYTGLTPSIVASGLNGPLFLASAPASVPASTPEPSDLSLFGLASLGLGSTVLRARRRKVS